MTNDASSNGPILVPVDFSTYSEAALAWAARLARDLSVQLVVLHVVHDPAESPGYYRQVLKQAGDESGMLPLRRIEDVAQEMMVEFLKDAASRHSELGPAEDIEARLAVGIPTTRIIEFSESVGARQIVMGSQGRTGLAHVLLGSKAEQVVRLSQLPVTVVKS